jgi:hypothetical protein
MGNWTSCSSSIRMDGWSYLVPIAVLIHTCKREPSPTHLVCPWRHNA